MVMGLWIDWRSGRVRVLVMGMDVWKEGWCMCESESECLFFFFCLLV